MSNHCRLFDENIVRNIMISTGVSIMEFVKDHTSVDTREICEFIEYNADSIIAQTLKNMNREEDTCEEKDSGNDIMNDTDDDEELDILHDEDEE